jgi:Transposase DDE domain group 1
MEQVEVELVPRMKATPASMTDCSSAPLLFPDLGSRKVVADFSGGQLSSDGGAMLLRQIDRALGVSRTVAGCFRDLRDARFVDHSVEHLVAQRLHALALGYEDLNDHATLRLDPLLAVAVGKIDPLGQDRLQDRGTALAAPSTLNRLELSNCKATRYHKLSHDPVRMRDAVLKLALRCLPKHSQEIVLDLDLMGHLVHGLQEGRHFSAYYDGYCYQPLYVVCGQVVLWAQLRSGDCDPKEDVVAALKVILPALRQHSPKARIVIRADSGFCRDELMNFCESQSDVYFVLGLGRNSLLESKVQAELFAAAARRCLCGTSSAREFTEFSYQTHRSWSRERRVIGKAEVTTAGNNPRFVVTSLPLAGFANDPSSARRFTPEALYEEVYCQRGNMENILKQQVLDLESDRMSTHHLASNQLRLWLATVAYLLLERLRALALAGTELAKATAGTIRVKLLKVATAVKVSVRRVYLQFCSAFPLQEVFRLCQERLKNLPQDCG